MNNFKTTKEGNITENLVTPVILGADVAVAGGGVAGIAAALSAARAGAKVVLIERGFMLGGLATAGRCTSVTDGLWDVMRVIPCCAVTGEAAGLAAAITDDITAFGVETLQSELVKRGVKLHESELSR